MSRLVWGAASERLFEAGVDRGVLYKNGSPGVSWSGLVSISESPSGGEARPFYFDGIKYLNISAAEEYEAVIVAISAPREFNECDGILSIQNGLLITQQPRQSFGFSYRTQVGNAVESIDHGYKIHLIYNALAAPSQRNHQTLGDSAEPTAFSWRISTLAPEITGFKRTAHLVVDSRYTDPGVLTQVEDLLYGTEITDPTLPTPDELIAIFEA